MYRLAKPAPGKQSASSVVRASGAVLSLYSGVNRETKYSQQRLQYHGPSVCRSIATISMEGKMEANIDPQA